MTTHILHYYPRPPLYVPEQSTVNPPPRLVLDGNDEVTRRTFEKNTAPQPHLVEDDDFPCPYNLRPRPVSNVLVSSPRVLPSLEPVPREELTQRLALGLSGVRHSQKITKLHTSYCNTVFDPISSVSQEYPTLSTGPDKDT